MQIKGTLANQFCCTGTVNRSESNDQRGSYDYTVGLDAALYQAAPPHKLLVIIMGYAIANL